MTEFYRLVVGGALVSLGVGLIVWLQRLLRRREQLPVSEHWRNEHTRYPKDGDHRYRS